MSNRTIDTSKENFIDHLLMTQNLTSNEKFTMMVISHISTTKGVAIASPAYISELTGLSTSSSKKALSGLERKQWLGTKSMSDVVGFDLGQIK